MAGKIAAFFGAQDLTQGKPMRGLIQFSVPLLIGNLAQQLYNTVDSIVVGKYVGDNALAAVGASGPILNLLLVLFMGIATGATIMVSQYFGARQHELLSTTVGNTITLTVLSSVFIMVVGPLVTHPLMSLLNTPEDIYADSCTYLIIIFLGILGGAGYNILSGVLRGLGDSFMPLVYLVIACLLNIVLDLLFVVSFHWGVAGVAIATGIAQLVSAVLCLIRLLHMKEIVVVPRSSLRLHKELVIRLTKLGLPSGLAQAIFSLAAIVVQSLTNSFGTEVIAASIIVMRVDGFAMMPNFTFGTAMTTYAGQNIGAGKIDRVHQGTKSGMLLGLIVSSCLTVMILLFGRILMGWFTNTQAIIDLGFHMMCILAVGLYSHVCYTGPFRRDAWCWRYHDAHVDFFHYNRCYPCAFGIWHCFLYPQCRAAAWQSGLPVYFAAGFLGARRIDYLCTVSPRKMEAQGRDYCCGFLNISQSCK